MKYIAVFASGNGTTSESIMSYFEYSEKVKVALVVSNKAEAPVLERAKHFRVETQVVTKEQLNDEKFVMSLLNYYEIDFIVLAGFLLMIPPYLVNAYDHRMVNTHPSLLPRHGGKGMYGMRVHEAVKASGDSQTGFTVHYVSNECDGGDIIAKFFADVYPDDTPQDIANRVHKLELENYPWMIDYLLNKDDDKFNFLKPEGFAM